MYHHFVISSSSVITITITIIHHKTLLVSPLYNHALHQDVSQIWDELVANKVVGVPGRLCHPRLLDPSFRCPYLRLCFASASDVELDDAAARLGRVLQAHGEQ